jgi:thioredoxin 1
MNKVLMLFLIMGLSACQSHDPHQTQVVHHVGVISSTELLANYPEFAQEYQRYTPSALELSAIKILQNKTLLVLFGTWCHDSQREVPRLLKTIALSGIDNYDLSLLAVDFAKQEPSGQYLNYQLRYTPTFVLEQQGHEITRVVERPKWSIAEDLAAQSLIE